MTDLTFSFLPLSDAAPIIVAHARGLFQEHGIRSTLRRESSWTSLRDSMNSGSAQAAQMLYSMPLATACGLLGDNQKPLIIPWCLSRNGQGITLNARYRGQVAGDARNLRARAIEGRDSGRPLVFGHTLRVGTHSLWLRYWLAAGGVDPVNDVALITVPPAQMVANMRTSRVDGFCVGEPWNARALAESLGFTAITSQEIWPDHPEKVCVFTEEFAAEKPEAVVSSLRALHTAGVWLDDPANHPAASEILADAGYLDCAPALIRSRLGSDIDYGDGRTAHLEHRPVFARDTTNRPRQSHALWFLSQLRRWGLHFGTPDYRGVTARVIRTDLYEKALNGSAAAAVLPDPVETLFDGKAFDLTDPEAYARSFAIKNILG